MEIPAHRPRLPGKEAMLTLHPYPDYKGGAWGMCSRSVEGVKSLTT